MSDRFHQISMEQLTDWVFDELEQKDAIFGIPRSAFFVPSPDHRFRLDKYGYTLDTPFGVAAGPHTQMAQNIIVSWLVGARFIELKTVQTLDELDIPKPCIDVEDEGYNVEWSQELKVYESFDEYLRAWVLIYALHHKLGFATDDPGMIFNMSVGYNLEGILKPNVQWFLDVMRDTSDFLPAYVDIVAQRYAPAGDLAIPTEISDTVTLSTMHGCPPDEIERISAYLIEKRDLHTSVKCNPTLLGADRVHGIVNDALGFDDVPVPDEAFGHDLQYVDAVPMFHNLRRIASNHDKTFGLKLTNTLEVDNWRTVFDKDEMMYLSGRALHPITTNLAARIAEDYRSNLLLSYAGGADCFNVADLLRSGMTTVTVCSDLLKTGGYLRMSQYMEQLDEAMDEAGAEDLDDFTLKSAASRDGFEEFASMLRYSALVDTGLEMSAQAAESLGDALSTSASQGSAQTIIREWAATAGYDAARTDVLAETATGVAARLNLREYADRVRSDWRYQKRSFRTDKSSTPRELHYFDCIEAPCVDECPVDQKVPQYMNAVRDGDFTGALALAREDNPLPSVLGRVCDHLCENTCIRTHLDQPLAIREMKRFIMEQEEQPVLFIKSPQAKTKVAVIGAGPAGLAAAHELGYSGFEVTVFEHHPYPGGMVGGAIPSYRLPQNEIDQDMAVLAELGVEMRYGQSAGVDFTIEGLRSDGYQAVFVAVGAQLAKRLNIEGEDSEGVLDALTFLRSVREEHPVPIGARVGVVGAGDTAMDCVRSAIRVGAKHVSLIYRRTIDQMPADREEVHASIEEGIEIIELAKPVALRTEGGMLRALVCSRTEYRGDRDASQRKIPHDIADSEFEIPVDTLILAISQHSVLDLFGDEPPKLTSRGYIRVDPVTFESSIPGVYAGGDVADDGPSSIVKAAADGKAVAAAMVAAYGTPKDVEDAEFPRVNLQEMVVRRSRREYRTPVTYTPLDERDNFDVTTLTYTAAQAKEEAARCLDCHEICSLCVGVCPNMALMTYEIDPVRFEVPTLAAANGEVEVRDSKTFAVDQPLQIAVLTDFCNECGNCETACPTSGKPYVDKPRLYLDRQDFLAEDNNAFMMLGDSVMEGRIDGETHRISLNGSVEYESPVFAATLDRSTFAVESTHLKAPVDDAVLSLEAAAAMYTLLTGLEQSMPHLPVYAATGSGYSTLDHPGYTE